MKIEENKKIYNSNLLIGGLFIFIMLIGVYPYHKGMDTLVLGVLIVGVMFRVSLCLMKDSDYKLSSKLIFAENVKMLVLYYCWNTYMSIGIKAKLGVDSLLVLENVPIKIIFTAISMSISLAIVQKIEDKQTRKIIYYLLLGVNIIIFSFLAQ
ncbi:MAG: hypothetical protein ACRC30_11535 [Clostridium sp.]